MEWLVRAGKLLEIPSDPAKEPRRESARRSGQAIASEPIEEPCR
jgi:hypothetical protein